VATAITNVVQFDAGGDIFERRDLVPDGPYVVALMDYRTVKRFNRGCLEAIFKVIEGEQTGAILARFYVVMLTAKPKRRGKFKASRSSALLHDYAWCFGMPPRLDRIPFHDRFSRTPVIAHTRTVKKDSRGIESPPSLHWSTFERLRPVT